MRVLVKHLRNQIFNPGMRVYRKFQIKEFAPFSFGFLLSVLRKIPQNKPIKQNTECPNVSFEWIVILFVNQFRTHILWSTCQLHLRVISHHRQSQIYEFYLVIFIDQDVLCFQISVGNLFIVQVGQSLCDLNCYFSQNLLTQRPILTSIIRKRCVTEILHYDIDSFWCLK